MDVIILAEFPLQSGNQCIQNNVKFKLQPQITTSTRTGTQYNKKEIIKPTKFTMYYKPSSTSTHTSSCKRIKYAKSIQEVHPTQMLQINMSSP
jgi:hypothetical protein